MAEGTILENSLVGGNQLVSTEASQAAGELRFPLPSRTILSEYSSLIISTFGVTVPIFLAGIQLWNSEIIKYSGAVQWLAYSGLACGSFTIGLMANWFAFRSIARTRSTARRATENYKILRGRLSPVLTEGLDDLLQNRLEHLGACVGDSMPQGLHLYVFAYVDDGYQVVASTIDRNHPVRRMELSPNEGVIGFAAERGVPVIARSLQAAEDPGLVLSLSGEEIVVQPELQFDNLQKCDPHQKWILSYPVFDRDPVKPWKNEVLGALTVDIRAESGRELFLRDDFQDEVRYLAAEIATYLSSLIILWRGDSDE